MSSTPPLLAVTGVSLMCAAGEDARLACAAIRAGVTRFREHAYHLAERRDPAWNLEEERLKAAPVPSIDPRLKGIDRLLALALPALRGLVNGAKLLRSDLASTALLLGAPEPAAPVGDWALERDFATQLARRTGLWGFGEVRVSALGHTAMLSLLGDAADLLNAGRVSRCIVLGIDSYLSADRIAALDAAHRLKSRRGRDGFIPGEAASALMVELMGRGGGDSPSGGGRGIWVTLSPPSFGVEPEPLASPRERASTGSGLSAALRGILQQWPRERAARWVLCDLNGESYRAFEWGVAGTRLSSQFGAGTRVVRPASNLGDVGAATGGVLVACAAHAFGRGYAPDDRAVLWASSEGGSRVAVCATRPSPGGSIWQPR